MIFTPHQMNDCKNALRPTQTDLGSRKLAYKPTKHIKTVDNALYNSIYQDELPFADPLDNNLDIYLKAIQFDNKNIIEDFWKHKYCYYLCFFIISCVNSCIIFLSRMNWVYVFIQTSTDVSSDSQYDIILCMLVVLVVVINCYALRFKQSFKLRFYVAICISGLGLLSSQIANMIGWQTNYNDQQYIIQYFIVFGSCFMIVGVILQTILVFTQGMHLPPYYIIYWKLGQVSMQLSFQPGFRLFYNYYAFLGDLNIIGIILIQLGWIAILFASALSFNYQNKKRDHHGNVYDNLENVKFNVTNLKSIIPKIKWSQIITIQLYWLRRTNISIHVDVFTIYLFFKDGFFVGVPSKDEMNYFFQQLIPTTMIIFTCSLIGAVPFMYIVLTKWRCNILSIIMSLISISINLVLAVNKYQAEIIEYTEFNTVLYVFIMSVLNSIFQGGLDYCSWFLIFNNKRIVRGEKEIAVNLFILFYFLQDYSV